MAERIPMRFVLEEDWSVYDLSRVPDSELSWTKTVCPYCGVGCGLSTGVKDGKIHKVRPDASHPANLGLLCAKGATLPQTLDTPDRAVSPLWRAARGEAFAPIGWEKAIPLLAGRIRRTLDEHGPDSFAFYISGQLLSEDYYVINKFAKGMLGTNNVDSNSRLCMASAVSGYVTSLGEDGPPASYSDIELSKCFFLIGTNAAACHPVTFQRIRNRAASDPEVKVIVADPRRTPTADIAHIYLPLRPGTDVALLNGMLRVLKSDGLLDADFIRGRTEGWEALERAIEPFDPRRTAEICGLLPRDVISAAHAFGKSPSALSLWSMGLNQSSSGTAKNNAVINLHLATGKIGKPGSGPFSLTGQPNAMGGRETGGLCHLLPGHRFIADPDHRAAMEKLWGVPPGRIAPKPGLHAVDLFRAVEEKKVKIVWVIATNPAVSMPNAGRARRALEEAELVIAQDPYHPTETTSLAHLVLPAAQWSEREGTVTNSERRISLARKVVEPPGAAKPDWWIVARVAREMGWESAFPYEKAEDVFEEYKRTTAGTGMDLSGASYERLAAQPLQWPCPRPDSPADVPRLYADGKFPTPSGRARFAAYGYVPPAELPDADFPMILTTGRVRDQWHTMTRTGKIDALVKSEPYAFVEIHPEDAARQGVSEGEMIEIATRRGKARAPARLTDRIRPGTCFVPFHWGSFFGEATVNDATIEAFDPASKQPELKFCACRLTRVNDRVRDE